MILPQGLFLDTIYSSSCSRDSNYPLRVGHSARAPSLSDATGDSFITCCRLSHLRSRRVTRLHPRAKAEAGAIPTGTPGPDPAPPALQSTSPCTALTLLFGFSQPPEADISPHLSNDKKENKPTDNSKSRPRWTEYTIRCSSMAPHLGKVQTA